MNLRELAELLITNSIQIGDYEICIYVRKFLNKGGTKQIEISNRVNYSEMISVSRDSEEWKVIEKWDDTVYIGEISTVRNYNGRLEDLLEETSVPENVAYVVKELIEKLEQLKKEDEI